jgi:hypothetical protein
MKAGMSEHSLGVGLAWQLAGAEAVHGGHERIEPAPMKRSQRSRKKPPG